MRNYWIAFLVTSLLLAPLMPGVINKTKAFFAGRKGPRLLQNWFDICKLLKKGTVYSRTANFWFRLMPGAALVLTATALLLLPAGNLPSPLAFSGDALLFLYLLGTVRLLTVLSALDTGSSFEGMGASRELQFSLGAEAMLILLFAALAITSGSCDLAGMFTTNVWFGITSPATVLSIIVLFIAMLTECCRLPVDDPETHLELTMIHEAMILDNSGPDLGFIHYTAALKMWLFAALLTRLAVPAALLTPAASLGSTALGAAVVSLITGIIESSMARRRFLRLPRLMLAGVILEAAAIVFALVQGGNNI